jgi:hypothetical protein
VKRSVMVGGSYFTAMTLWIYGVVEPSVGYGSDAAAAVGLSTLALLHVAVGYALHRGWAPLLVLGVPLLAYPAGYADRGEFLIWQGFALVAPIGALMVFAGVALRFVLTGRRGSAVAGPHSPRVAS